MLSAALALLVLAPAARAQTASTLAVNPNETLEVMLLKVSASSRCQQACVVRGQPYSAERVSESVQVLADGNRIVKRSLEKVYRDSDGRTRVESEWQGKPLVQIQDPVQGVSYRLYPETKTGLRMAIAAPAPAAAVTISAAGAGSAPAAAKVAEQLAPALVSTIASGDNQSTTRSLGTREMEGVTVEGTLVSRTTAAGAAGNTQPIVRTSETWNSRDLRVAVYSKTSDPRYGDTVTRLQNLARLEPPAALFSAPAEYTVQEVVRR
jgi:hypothetical protein